MARLTLEIPDDTHRKLKTLAAYSGMSMKDFLITRALNPSDRSASEKNANSEAVHRLDDMLFSETAFKLSPENWDIFSAALEAPPKPNAKIKKLMTARSALDE